jgi:uncharacterized protein (DUF2235 family)
MGKRIVVYSDGTWNTADQEHPTNVVKLHRATKDVAPEAQAAFYDEGVGVEGGRFDRLTGGAFGRGLNQNIVDAYRSVIERYEPGEGDQPATSSSLSGSAGARTRLAARPA